MSLARRPAVLVVVAAVATVGLVATYAWAYRTTSGLRYDAFWVTYLAGLAVAATVALRPGVGPRARTAVLIGAGVFTYLPKLCTSPWGPTYYDEFGQLRHAADLLVGATPTPPSTYLPILRYYPGLGLAAGLTHDVTRLSLWHSGQLVVLVAHCATLLLVRQLALAAGLGPRRAVAAALLFALNPSFAFFDTQFAYESLGIALLMAVVLAAWRARQAPSAPVAAAWALGGVVAAEACTLTHHVSTAVMLVLLVLVAALVPATVGADAPPALRRAVTRAPWLLTGVAAAMAALWWGVEATPTVSYISPHLDQSLTQLAAIAGFGSKAAASTALHVPFSGGNGQAEEALPFYEPAAAYLAPLVALALCVAGALSLRRRGSTALLRSAPLLVLAALYFVSLPVALASGGGEVAHRAWSFTYIGVAVVAAAGLPAAGAATGPLAARLAPRVGGERRLRRFAAVALPVALVVLAVGNVSSGESPLYRFPGPYVFGVDARANTADARALAGWMRAHLPAGAKVLADKDTNEVVTAYTRDVTASPDDAAAYSLYRVGPDVGTKLAHLLRRHGFGWFVLDTRIVHSYPLQSFFAGDHTARDIDKPALGRMAEGTFAVLTHTVGPYQVYFLDYAARP